MNKKEERFVQTVWEYYRRHGMHSLPWRRTRNPYRILVSESMLQQTQVERVLPKYKEFLTLFPTVQALARAPLSNVLRAWQGLGYNRRAKMLHECAKIITNSCRGRTPTFREELEKLPGVGRYTAGAIMAFAWNEPVPIIETNIRSVYIHHFFRNAIDVSDAEIYTRVERTLDEKRVREWYYALMDYGVYIKKTYRNPNSRSKHYTKQSPFIGSDRQIRGAILRALATKSYTHKEMHTTLQYDTTRIDAQLERLCEEGMVMKRGMRYTLPAY